MDRIKMMELLSDLIVAKIEMKHSKSYLVKCCEKDCSGQLMVQPGDNGYFEFHCSVCACKGHFSPQIDSKHDTF